MIAKQRALPAAEAMERHGNRDRHIDADHARLNTVGEGAGRIAIACEDRGSVAVLVLVDQCESGVEVAGADDSEDRSEDLFTVDAHLGLYMVEEAGSDEESGAFREC